MPQSRLKALVFDAYGTLFDVHSVKAMAEQLFPGRGNELSEQWRTSQLQYTWLKSLMEQYEDFEKVTEDALVFACRKLNLDFSKEDRTKLMDAYRHLDPFPEVREALARAAFANLPLAILSNGSPSMLRAVVENSGLEGAFRNVISVDEVKIYKPSPKVYQLAVDAFQTQDRSEIGFVSANGWDVAGAASFGFTAYWINRANAPLEELGPKPAKVLSKLTDLINAL
jgi:2-haloacid dehalogenase